MERICIKCGNLLPEFIHKNIKICQCCKNSEGLKVKCQFCNFEFFTLNKERCPRCRKIIKE